MVNYVALIIASFSALGSLASVIVAFLSFRANHRTNVQPVLVFARRTEKSDDWQVENVGKGPALNVHILDQNDSGEWFACVGYYPFAVGIAVHLWTKGLWANGLAAVYSDVYGRWYTSICTNNQNIISKGNKFPDLKETSQEYPKRIDKITILHSD